MTFSKLRLAPGIALVVSMSCFCVSQAQPVWSQEQEQQAPAEGEQQAAPEQAAPEQTAPADDGTAAQPSGDSAEPPAAPSEQAAPADRGTTTEAPQDSTEAPAQPEQPAATEGAPAEGGAAINASQIQVGEAVFGSDGAKIGEVNGVKSDDSGKVQEILVTDGMPAGINAKVFEVPADKITSVADGVKLSLTSEEAKQLPIIDNSNG